MATSGKDFRLESDLIGERQISNEHLYGVQTLRGIENFNISNFHLSDYPLFIHGLAWTKEAAAIANHRLGLLSDQQKDAIVQACHELLDGKHHQHFPVDMIQGGAGTTTNMNANEVICNRALEIMGHEKGEFKYLSPNDHVNGSQSTNDAYPTAIHLGLYASHLKLRPHFLQLIEALEKKAKEFAHVVKMGRTQLQDAVPMTLGQTFGGFASILRHEVANLDYAAQQFLAINMGATAIGTGISSEPEYADYCTEAMAKITGWDITRTDDFIGATSDTSEMVGYSSALRRIAIKVNKICNDLRLLSSGPRCGLGEINLPAMQINGFDTLRTLCIDGITANEDKCRDNVRNSIGIVTALNPIIGYKNSTKIAKEALETGRGVYDLIIEHGILSQEDLDTVLAPENMIKPVRLGIKAKK